MSTGSTKSRDRKTTGDRQTISDREAAGSSSNTNQDTFDARSISPLVWRVASLTILAGAAFIRLYKLSLVPMHHDEGVNGFFLTNLYRTGVYHYDPTNYHGPTLYYFALVIAKINALFFGKANGLSTVGVRLVPALFGIGTVWLILCLRRNIGTIGALAAAAFVALSPGDIYVSRYFIHEAQFVFFTLGIVVAALRYYESADPIYLLLATLSAALLFATKETAMVNVVVLILALIVAVFYIGFWKVFEKAGQPGWASIIPVYNTILLLRIADKPWWWIFLLMIPFLNIYFLIIISIDVAKNFGKGTGFGLGLAFLGFIFYPILGFGSAQYISPELFSSRKQQRAQAKRSARRRAQQQSSRIMLARFGGMTNLVFWSSVALAVFLVVNILFYSSFFTYWQGVDGALQSLQVWVRTGTNSVAHDHPLSTYLIWLWQLQAPLLVLGAAGALIALIRRRNRFTIFAGAWAFGIFAAYSLIPYKTPWLMINFTVPLAIIGGYAINEIYNFEGELIDNFVGKLWSRILAFMLVAIALVISGTQSVILNFYHYDDEHYAYVYAHTYREFLPMVSEIERLAKRAGTGTQIGITITADEYWPLPWYLRDYDGAAFYGYLVDRNGQTLNISNPILVTSEKQETEYQTELQTALGDRYQRIGSYPLRPGVTLVLYAQKELAAP